MKYIKIFVQSIKDSYESFMLLNSMKLSASLAYYTIFSIPPLIMIVISIVSFFYGADAVNGTLYGQIAALVGPTAASDIQGAVKKAELSNNGSFATTVGVLLLFFGASGVFAEIQSSINFIWGLQTKPKKGFVKFIMNRVVSLSMVITFGFLLMISLVLNAALDFVYNYLTANVAQDLLGISFALNLLLVFIIVSILFFVIFNVLPDGKVHFRTSILSSLFTAILFMLGKYILSYYLQNTKSVSPYGTAGSITVVLVWVYYSSIILYFGANFTKVLSETVGHPILPNRYSIQVDIQQVIEEAEKRAQE